MSNIPKDPVMLLSFINTKLRDEYTSLNLLCNEMNINEITLTDSLKKIDYIYDESLNQFK